jgi:hypothetical protein
MKKLPGAKEVHRKIKETIRAVKLAVKMMNQQAGQRLGKGDYQSAEQLMAQAKKVQEFGVELDELLSKWQEISRSGTATGPKERKQLTPLWEYYKPILKALTKLGGKATSADLEEILSSEVDKWLKPDDFQTTNGNRLRWHSMVRRAKRPMTKEGWVEPGTGKVWQLTREGTRAAQRSGR